MKLLIEEPGSGALRACAAAHPEGASSALTYLEARSALARMCAGGRLRPAAHRRKIGNLDSLWENVAAIDVEPATLEHAVALSDKHVLRAHDSLQLASALVVADAESVTFACFDDALCSAAAAAGLEVFPAQAGRRSS